MATPSLTSSKLNGRRRESTVSSQQTGGNRVIDMRVQNTDRQDSQPVIPISSNEPSSDSPGGKKVTKLLKAARARSSSKVRELLDQKEDRDWFNGKIANTTLFATLNGALPAMKSKKIKPEDLERVLDLDKYTVIVERLLQEGAGVDAQDLDNRTPLLLVASGKFASYHNWVISISDWLISR